MGLDQKKRRLYAGTERRKLIIERLAEVLEEVLKEVLKEVHQLMLMYSSKVILAMSSSLDRMYFALGGFD